MEALADSNHGLRLRDVSAKLGIPRSSAHSLLLALERRGYLQRNDSTGRYSFGPKILGLANVALRGMTLREVAYPVLLNLMRVTGLGVNMAVLDRRQVVLIEQIEPVQVSAPMVWLGTRLDLHCTALGKALAAFQPREEWEQLVKLARPRHNDNTISSSGRFLGELVLTRERGYAVDNEEFRLGIRCLAAPVFGGSGGTAAGISVKGRTSEIHDGNVESLVKLLLGSASAISQALGSSVESSQSRAAS
jgi:DNA-binding IclR family transcriptional regulator